jgi:hypothetical protein
MRREGVLKLRFLLHTLLFNEGKIAEALIEEPISTGSVHRSDHSWIRTDIETAGNRREVFRSDGHQGDGLLPLQNWTSTSRIPKSGL